MAKKIILFERLMENQRRAFVLAAGKLVTPGVECAEDAERGRRQAASQPLQELRGAVGRVRGILVRLAAHVCIGSPKQEEGMFMG